MPSNGVRVYRAGFLGSQPRIAIGLQYLLLDRATAARSQVDSTPADGTTFTVSLPRA